MPYTFTVSDIIPATPQAIYDAWLDSRGHSAMTGSKATASAEVGGAFTAWDGYISGRNVQLVPGTRIVQTWRTTGFDHSQQYSTITVLLTEVRGGTRVSVTHANVPDDHKGYENGGWQEHYFNPMKAHFGEAKAKPKAAAPKAAKAKAAPAKPARPAAAKTKASKAKSGKAKTAKAKASKAKTAKAKAKAQKAAPKKAKAKTTRPSAAKRTKTAKRAKTVRRKVAARKTAKRTAPKRKPARAKKRK